MIDLMACPHCGGEAGIFANGGVAVVCKKCHCQTRLEYDMCYADFSKHPVIDKLIKTWNRRPEPIAAEEYEGTFYCGNCSEPVNRGDNYCRECGKAVKWE